MAKIKELTQIEIIENSKIKDKLKFLNYTFIVKGISRLVLQELARHRIASYSVKSTRYTISELKKALPFITFNEQAEAIYHSEEASKFINFSGNECLFPMEIQSLENLRFAVASGYCKNDEVKYIIPECYKLDLYMTFNARSFQNFMTLRDSDKAHFEIQELAQKAFASIPVEHRFMYKVRTQP